MKNGDKSAFPSGDRCGLTKREHMALELLKAHVSKNGFSGGNQVRDAVTRADTLLEFLEEPAP